jgi:CheY-like chemotaxis protein
MSGGQTIVPAPHQRDLPVLLIEPDEALRRVMAVGLRQRGLRVVEARSLGEAWERVAAPPAAIVLDVGLGPNSEWMLLRTLRAHRVLSQAPLAVLAWECPTAAALGEDCPPPHVCLTKPFDARALYVAVEDLLLAPSPVPATVGSSVALANYIPSERAMPLPDAPLPARQSAAPSVWPLVTAGGATLALAGFLIHIALVVIGVTLILAAVLLWSGEAGDATEPATPASSVS